MSIGFGIELPRIENEDVFEKLCFDLISIKNKFENVQYNGVRGQKQDGVDIFARYVKSKNWIGIQSKVRTKGKINFKEIDEEISKALKFNPKLSKFFIFTTAKRDAKIQEHVRIIADSHIKKGLFDIQINFWEDISILLKEDSYKSIHYKYYQEFYSNIKEDGFSYGKLIELTVGYKNDTSRYELLLGKIYQTKGNSYNGLNYWKDIKFIMNMNEYAFEIFTYPCHSSDIESTFKVYRDRKIICLWLNSIYYQYDDFLKSSNETYKFEVSDEDFEKFIK